MLEEARKMRVGDWLTQCRIQAVSIQDHEYYKELIEDFKSMLPLSPEEIVRAHEKAASMELQGKSAKKALAGMFGGVGVRR